MGEKEKKLNRIERIKKELHPFEEEFKRRMERYFEEGDYKKIPPDDIERLKWYGIFYRKATPGYFMIRIRVPGGVLSYRQAKRVAELAKKYARNLVEITSRQQLQIRWVELKNIKTILEGLDEVGLTTLQTGIDNPRNVVQDPLAGLAYESVIDTTPLVFDMTKAILGKREFADLPRKVNPAILGSTRDPINALYNDITFYLAERDGEYGFNLYLGGKIGSGGPQKGFDMDMFLRPEEVVEVFKTVLRIYAEKGYRDNRNRNRLYFLVRDMGIEQFREEIERRLGKEFPFKGEDKVKTYGERVGIIPQKGELHAVDIGVPSGKISAEDFEKVAELAKRYGNGELRLSTYQNIYVVNIPASRVRELTLDSDYEYLKGLDGAWVVNTIACAGSDTCHFGVIENKSDAQRVAKYLSSRIPLDSPIRIHWSACVKGCGQHGAADVGFVGTKIKVGDTAVPAVEVFLGGNHHTKAKKVGKVPLEGLEKRLEDLFRYYYNNRRRGETFFHFVHRKGVNHFKKFFEV